MASDALIGSLKTLRLPGSVVLGLLQDYMDFASENSPGEESTTRFLARIEEDKEFETSAALEVEGAMLAASLMMTLESDVDFKRIATEVFPLPVDSDLRKLRNELLARTYHMSKDIPEMAGISVKLVKERMQLLMA